MQQEIPSNLIKELILEFKKEYGATYPLYGSETKRHDISGSIRPLLSSTEIPIEKVIVERSGIPKKTITKIMNGDIEFISFDMADTLLCSLDMEYQWYDKLSAYY